MEKEGNMPVMSSETVNEFESNSETENLKKVEAALFISARFLNLQELVMLTDINPLMIRELLQKLIERYNRDDSAIEIIIKENMWKMDVRQDYVPMINKLATGNAEFSSVEQETLAVIAYKQPVKQSVIIKIRGNKAYEHIKHFTEIGLVISKKAGHTKELKLSDDFFEYFHLQKKEQGGKTIAVEEPNDVEEGEEGEEREEDSKKKYTDIGKDENKKIYPEEEAVDELKKGDENIGNNNEDNAEEDSKKVYTNEEIEEIEEDEGEDGEEKIIEMEKEEGNNINNTNEININKGEKDDEVGEVEEKDKMDDNNKDEFEDNNNQKKEKSKKEVVENEVIMEGK